MLTGGGGGEECAPGACVALAAARTKARARGPETAPGGALGPWRARGLAASARAPDLLGLCLEGAATLAASTFSPPAYSPVGSAAGDLLRAAPEAGARRRGKAWLCPRRRLRPLMGAARGDGVAGRRILEEVRRWRRRGTVEAQGRRLRAAKAACTAMVGRRRRGGGGREGDAGGGDGERPGSLGWRGRGPRAPILRWLLVMAVDDAVDCPGEVPAWLMGLFRFLGDLPCWMPRGAVGICPVGCRGAL